MKLEGVKVGDKVLRTMGGWGRRMEILTVEKVSKLHVTVGGDKYRISSGYKAGDSWSSSYSIIPFDQKEWDDYLHETELRKRRYFLRDFNWETADESVVKQVYEILNATKS